MWRMIEARKPTPTALADHTNVFAVAGDNPIRA